jgi:AcrR family transcriptional regulator
VSREDDARAVILAAAAHEMAESGFHGMSMRDLARATGRSLSSFYTHFPSKEDILFALHVEAFDALLASAERAIAPASDPSERLHAFVLGHVRYFVEHRDLMRVLLREAAAVPAPQRSLVRARKDRYFAMGRDLLRAVVEPRPSGGDAARRKLRIDDAELDRATYALFGMMNWIHAWYDPERHGDAADVARTIHRVAVHGVAELGDVAPRPARVAGGTA